MKSNVGGLGKKERTQLGLILKSGVAVITPREAARALKIEQGKAAQLLARWNKKGWLTRLKRGAYIPVPIQSQTPEVMADEPWVLAKSLFSPCYIGGWSAAEHWDFTEQMFNSVMVFTSKKIDDRELDLKSARFTLKTIKPERIFGLKTVWLQNQKVDVSDPTRTIIDAFNDPATVGGIRMAIDILEQYMRSEHKNTELLFDYALKMKNTAIFKRIGFVFSQYWPGEKTLTEKFRKAIKPGYSQLDPAVPGKTLVTIWGLWVPPGFKKK
jgi:predicted transcriptional regulator of viral defense system